MFVFRDDALDLDLRILKQGEYNVVYVTPEKTLARKGGFLEMIKRNDSLRDRIIAVIFDEAHCITDWGYSFRPEYANVPNIRVFLNDVPVAALTATLTPEGFTQLGKILKIKSDNALLLRESSNRMNLYYGVAPITRGELETYKDLSFLIPSTGIDMNSFPQSLVDKIPLTIIYANTKHIIDDIATALQRLLPVLWSSRPYGPHRAMDDV